LNASICTLKIIAILQGFVLTVLQAGVSYGIEFRQAQ